MIIKGFYFFLGAVFYNHLRSYFPKTEGIERLQVILEHMLYYPACVVWFLYIVGNLLTYIEYVA